MDLLMKLQKNGELLSFPRKDKKLGGCNGVEDFGLEMHF